MQPQSVTLLPNGSQQFTDPDATKWVIAPSVGTINNDGLYTAPSRLWLSRTVDVSALDAVNYPVSHATVTISSARSWMGLLGIFWTVLSLGLMLGIFTAWPPPSGPPSIAIYPVAATLQKGETLQFLSSSSGIGDTAVVWSTSDGDITPSGVFSAPAAPKDRLIKVTAMRNSDHTQTSTAQVIIDESRLVMSRSVIDASAMKDGTPIDFQALGQGGTQNGLSWYLSGPGEIDGKNGSYKVRGKSGSMAIVTAVDPKSARRAAAAVILSAPEAVGDSNLLVLVMLMGAFGALLGAVRSFVNFVGSRSFAPSWSFYYLSRPMFGAGLALIVFLAYRSGAVTGPKGTSPADPFTAGFVAAIVGLFADTVLQKLKETIEELFRPQDARTDKLQTQASAPPTITRLELDHTELTIIGTHFLSGASVVLNNLVKQPRFVDSTKLTVDLPGELAVVGTKVNVVVTNPDGVKSSPVTVTV